MGARYSVTSPSLVCARDADDAVAFPDQFRDRRFLPDFRALCAGVVEQHLVELGAQHLPGLRDGLAVVAVEKIKRQARAARGRNELHAVFLHERGFFHPVHQAEPLQRLVGEGQQRFADVVAGKFLPFQHQHAMAFFREQGGGGGAGRAGADDENVAIRFGFHVRVIGRSGCRLNDDARILAASRHLSASSAPAAAGFPRSPPAAGCCGSNSVLRRP